MSKNKITARVTEAARQARALAADIVNCDEAIQHSASWLFNTPTLMAQATSFRHALAARLIDLAEVAVEAEHARTQEAADDDAPRKARDEAQRDLHRAVSDAKDYLGHVMGKGAAARYGLSGELRRRPHAFSAFVHNTIALMESDPLQRAGRFGGGVDTVLIVAELKPLLDALDAALQEVAKEAVEYRDALNRRDEALMALSITISSSLAIHTATLTIARRHDLIRAARAIRKSPPSRATNITPELAEQADPAPQVSSPQAETPPLAV